MDAIRWAISTARDPKATIWISPLVLTLEAALCSTIILKIPYTEIDWTTYMQQVSLYQSGEKNYAKLTGSTGPLVYPAAHLYIYTGLSHLTSAGSNILLAQCIFALLYLATLALVLATYRAARVPPWVLPLLVLSKRLHSIFVLRLFNDCWAAFFLFAAIAAWQRKLWTVGSLVFSLGVAVKMSLLLAVPGVGVMLLMAVGRDRALKQAVLMVQLQVMLGYEFLGKYPHAYITRAFEFSRQFMFKWTVNWRFVGEETFLSKPFSRALLGAQAILLLVFLSTRWLRPANTSLAGIERLLLQPPPKAEQEKIARRVTPDFVLTTVLSSMLIGCLCARSLHYQFFAYIAWSTPFLLWRSGLHPVGVYVVWAAQEWAWNVYPSTAVSSMVVVGCLVITLAATWLGTADIGKSATIEQDTQAVKAE